MTLLWQRGGGAGSSPESLLTPALWHLLLPAGFGSGCCTALAFHRVFGSEGFGQAWGKVEDACCAAGREELAGSSSLGAPQGSILPASLGS